MKRELFLALLALPLLAEEKGRGGGGGDRGTGERGGPERGDRQGPEADGTDGLLPFAGPSRLGDPFLLGRPTDAGATVSVRSPVDGTALVEFGEGFASKTVALRLKTGEPATFVLTGCRADATIPYRVRWTDATGKESLSPTHAFSTRRSPGSTFTFAIEADPHLDANSDPSVFSNSLARMRELKPDFLVDLGDTFMCEKLIPQTQERVIARHLLMRGWFETLCADVPLFLTLGNHEGEFGWQDKKTSPMLPRWALECRTKWFPNPVPDGFYVGNDRATEDGIPFQNYYAFTWGDALFVMLDVYRHATRKPSRKEADNWAATIGEEQYRWMRRTLEGSKAAFKFVFAHQLAGGSQEGGRGGVEFAHLYEWGGKNRDGSDGFEAKRPGWGKPIHRVFVDTGVSVFFHGHDHLYARQELDGVVYQECPQPSARNTMEPNYAAEYGYKEGTILGNSGFLKVEVGPTKAVVSYDRVIMPKGNWGAAPELKIADRWEISPRK